MDENNTVIDGDPRSPSEREADRKIEALENELQSLSTGTNVIIERLRPSWCKGVLEKFCVGDEGIDVDYLIRTWGGEVLSLKVIGDGNRIRGSHVVELYTFEPRKYGRKLKPPHQYFDDDGDEKPVIPTSVQVSQPDNSNLELMRSFFEAMDKQRQGEIETLKTLLVTTMSQKQPETPSISLLSELKKVSGIMEMMREMSGNMSGAQPASSEDQFPGQIMDMMRMFMSRPPEQKPRIIAPVGSVRRAASPISENKADPKPSASITPIRDDIYTQLGSMDPNVAADTLITALSAMPLAKRDATIEAFWTRFNETMPEQFEEYEEDEEDENQGERKAD